MDEHDEVLRKHREKFQQHRSWMEQQSSALRDMQPGRSADGASPTSAAAHTPHSLSSPPPAVQHQQPSPARQQYSARRQSSAPGFADSARSMDRSGSRAFSSRSTGDPLNVHARSTQWAKRREQKIDELKLEHEVSVENDCPFRPEIHPVSPVERTSPEASSPVRGYENFVARQDKARAIRAAKVLKVQCDGSKWINAVTVPEEFSLGVAARRPIGALKQPISAPTTRTVADLHDMLHDDRMGTSRDGSLDRATPAVAPRGAFSIHSSSAIIDMATHTD